MGIGIPLLDAELLDAELLDVLPASPELELDVPLAKPNPLLDDVLDAPVIPPPPDVSSGGSPVVGCEYVHAPTASRKRALKPCRIGTLAFMIWFYPG